MTRWPSASGASGIWWDGCSWPRRKSDAMSLTRSTTAWRRLERAGQVVRLAMEDWGRGFVPEAVMSGGGAGERVGLASMQQRVAWLGGQWAVHGGEPTGRRHARAGRGAAAYNGRRCA